LEPVRSWMSSKGAPVRTIGIKRQIKSKKSNNTLTISSTAEAPR
jgi:hypothetical protein